MPSADTASLDCPLCGPTQFTKRFVKKVRHFWRCTSCGIERQAPLPTADELKAYYEAAYSDGMYKIFTSATLMKEMTAARRLKEIKRQIAMTGRWLDVGCSNGTFVKAALDDGVDAQGIELSDTAVAQATAQGLPVRSGGIESIAPDDLFDGITAFDVLEHVLDPSGFLRQIYARLAPGGRVVLTLPNLRSLSAKLMGERWYFYIPEEHMHYFEPKTLAALGDKLGFETVALGRTYKPLSYDYSLTQFQEYNPLIYRVLNTAGRVLPKSLRSRNFALPIGEMMWIAERRA